MNSQDERSAHREALIAKLNTVLDEGLREEDGPAMMSTVLGQLLARRKGYDRFTTGGNTIPWMIDAYTAAIVGPLAENLLRLHQFLVRSGATPENPHDFENVDRYGVAFSDAGWKSMALMTQNYTYMVVLQPEVGFNEDATGQIQRRDTWAVHIRMCTQGRYSQDFTRPDFTSLTFLNEHEKVNPERGYSDKANSYFQYKDGRDRGYLCSVKPEIFGQGFTVEDSMAGSAFSYLSGVLYDLGCHCSCLPKEASVEVASAEDLEQKLQDLSPGM